MISWKKHDNCRKGPSVFLHQKKSKFYEGQGVNNAFGVGVGCRSKEFLRSDGVFPYTASSPAWLALLLNYTIHQFMKEKGGKRHFSSQKKNSEIPVSITL